MAAPSVSGCGFFSLHMLEPAKRLSVLYLVARKTTPELHKFCFLCKFYYLLFLFAFRDIRKHLKRTQLQQDSRRRAAVNEMIRQRAAEAAGAQ